MIKFFRKIRQNLIQENRLSKYLIYALGEIVLVVIGILIALALNNANLNRIQADNELNYLKGLRFEFQVSKSKLTELIAVNQKNLDGAKEILRYMHDEQQEITEQRLSELFLNTFSNDISFNSNNSLLNEMINSGSLKTISSVELRKQLTTWISTLEDIKRQETELGVQRERVLDLSRGDDFSIQTILDQTGVSQALEIPGPTSFHSNLGILDSRRFENNVLIFILTSEATKTNHYDPLMEDLNTILELLDLELGR
ncbi:hypothetical protein [Algoriphagus sp.]|uniref:hypothetical protein n=1 Tax=Algoriphagus sp. TaxID=1872435 RepID=UPI0025F79F01|nr:hypothetical protein [Algoriphagus sp.]